MKCNIFVILLIGDNLTSFKREYTWNFSFSLRMFIPPHKQYHHAFTMFLFLLSLEYQTELKQRTRNGRIGNFIIYTRKNLTKMHQKRTQWKICNTHKKQHLREKPLLLTRVLLQALWFSPTCTPANQKWQYHTKSTEMDLKKL